jgi:hypothetical protein
MTTIGGDMRYVVIAVLIVLTCLDLRLAQAEIINEHESLRGLPGVFVVTETIAQDAQADGLSQEAIDTAVELILRSNGIRIFTREQVLAMPFAPVLQISIGTNKQSWLSLYACAINVHLNQKVYLPYGSHKEVWAITWRQQSFGHLGERRLSEATTQVEKLIEKFANDFLAVNSH